jgi:hypothetical protein
MFSKILVRKFGRIKRVMSVTTKMALRMERVNFCGPKMSFTKESFFKIKSKATVCTTGQTEVFIRVNGSTFRWKGKGSLSGLIRVDTLEGTKMVRNMDQGCLLTRRTEGIMGCGSMGRSDLLKAP